MTRAPKEAIQEMRMKHNGGLDRLIEVTERRILEVESQDWVKG